MIPTKITDADLWAFIDTEPAAQTDKPARGVIALAVIFWTLLVWRVAS